MAVEEIKCWKTSDGMIHETKQKAAHCEVVINLNRFMHKDLECTPEISGYVLKRHVALRQILLGEEFAELGGPAR